MESCQGSSYSFEQLLDFISSFAHGDHPDKIYEELSGHLHREMGAASLLVFSYVKDGPETSGPRPIESYRHIWNRMAVGTEYSAEELGAVLGLLAQQGRDVKNFQMIEWQDSEYFVMFLGNEGRQDFFAMFRGPSHENLNRECLQYLARFMRNSFSLNERWKNANQLSSLIYIDDVTGLYNQRRLMKDVEFNIARYQSHGTSFLLLFIDIDFFKSVNDQYGHLIGTNLLLKLGSVLRACLRDSDLIYRYGGDEFVVLVPESDTLNGKAIGERILNAIKSKEFVIGGITFKLSVSIGMAVFPKDAQSSKDVLELADRMMYQAKNAGRGRVCLAEEYFR